VVVETERPTVSISTGSLASVYVMGPYTSSNYCSTIRESKWQCYYELGSPCPKQNYGFKNENDKVDHSGPTV